MFYLRICFSYSFNWWGEDWSLTRYCANKLIIIVIDVGTKIISVVVLPNLITNPHALLVPILHNFLWPSYSPFTCFPSFYHGYQEDFKEYLLVKRQLHLTISIARDIFKKFQRLPIERFLKLTTWREGPLREGQKKIHSIDSQDMCPFYNMCGIQSNSLSH